MIVGCNPSTDEGKLTFLPTVSETVEVATTAIDETGRFFEVELMANGELSLGSEAWKKGEEIVFTMTSDEIMTVEVGILAVLENGNYGERQGKEVELHPHQEGVTLSVPNDGTYGIYFINKTDEDVKFEVELNKALENL